VERIDNAFGSIRGTAGGDPEATGSSDNDGNLVRL